MTEIAPGVVSIDAASQMPRERQYRRRKLDRIERVYVHHSGRLGRPGLEGALNSARYVVRQRGFPGPAYHYWIPWPPVRSDAIVVYQLNTLDRIAWHTGGANAHGIGVALQGNTTRHGISDHQIEALEALLPWLRYRVEGLVLDPAPDRWLSWHSEADRFGGRAKPACPGEGAEAWLREYRQRSG